MTVVKSPNTQLTVPATINLRIANLSVTYSGDVTTRAIGTQTIASIASPDLEYLS